MIRNRIALLTLALACLLLAQPALAQDEAGEMSAEHAAMMEAFAKAGTPGAEHKMLAETAGTFKITGTMWMDPAAPPQVSTGTAERAMKMDGRVLEETVVMEIPGMGSMTGLARTGYDNVTGRYWSTWTDNMTTGVILMYGQWNEDGSAVFEGEAANPLDGKMKKMRIEMRIEGDKEISDFYEPGPDGTMMKTMELVYEPK